MARTLTNAISNNAKETFYRANEDVLEGVEILATLDGRTCPVCASIDRKRYKFDEPHPSLPIHHQCRCVLLPVTPLSDLVEESRPMAKADFMKEAERIYKAKYPDKDFAALADSTKKKYYYEAMREYERRTGEPAYTQVSGGVSFKDYFENHMTAQQQRDWLGPQRYKLYKDFKLPLDRFIPPYPNKRMTIVELKEQDKASFADIPAKTEAKAELHQEHLSKREKQRQTALDNRINKWGKTMKRQGVPDEIRENIENIYRQYYKAGKPPQIVWEQPKYNDKGEPINISHVTVDNEEIHFVNTNHNSSRQTIHHEFAHWLHRKKINQNKKLASDIKNGAIADLNTFKQKHPQITDSGLCSYFSQTYFSKNFNSLNSDERRFVVGLCDTLGSISNGKLGFGHPEYSGALGMQCQRYYGTKNYYRIQNNDNLKNTNPYALPYGEAIANIASAKRFCDKEKLKLDFSELCDIVDSMEKF